MSKLFNATPSRTVEQVKPDVSGGGWRDMVGLLVFYAAIFVFFAFLSPFFLSVENLINLLVAASTLGIVAVFMTMLMIGGGLDLSVGAALALTGMVIAVTMNQIGIWPAVVLGLVSGTLVGVANALLVTWAGINAVIATLGTLYVARGLALVISDGLTKPVFDERFALLGSGTVLGMPVPVVVALLLFAIGFVVMNYTTYGRALFMVGGNAEASFLAALPVKRYRFVAYTLSGFSAALAGVILTARLYAAAPQAATGLEFSVIAAVVLGGTSLAGGKGTLLGTALGVLILGTLNNGMTLLSLSSDYQQIVQGLVLALAVAIDQIRLGNVDFAVFRRHK
ncbi:MAG: ABC transporter permease [Anaerolineales bacterium]|nr:ABC transporter permease [Anaerolineales bacterium]